MKNKKTTSYIIWALAIVPVILSVLFWVLIFVTRQPSDHGYYDDAEIAEVEEPVFQEVGNATIYVGDKDLNQYFYGHYSYDSCTVENSFVADTLVIISTNKSIKVNLND